MLILTLCFSESAFLVYAAPDDPDDIKDSITKLEKKLKEAEKKQAALKDDLNEITGSLTVTERVIAKTQQLLKQTESTITEKEAQVEVLDGEILLHRALIMDLLRDLYYQNELPYTELLLSEKDQNVSFQTEEYLTSTEDELGNVLDEVQEMKMKVESEKKVLEEAKEDHALLLAVKNEQKKSLVVAKTETQEDIEDQQAIIGRLKKELNELEGDLSKLLGKSYNAKDIKEAVEFASKETGVPKGFLMGVLKMETNLGANVGGCTYAQVEEGAEKSYKAGKLGKRAWNTFLSRRETFKGIAKELDIDYKKQKVSCNPRGYVGTGGAMGVAQFMPDTWNAYKAEVSKKTGHRPPSPWNLTDGVMAMALKLGRVPGVTKGDRAAWKRAAAAYLGTSYAPYINGILYWADHYKELL